MSTLYGQQSKNIRKTWALMSLFLIIVVGVGYFLSQYFGNPNFLYFFVIFSIAMNISAYWFSDKIALSIAGAKEAKKAEYFDLYTTVENLSITAGLPMPRVFVIPDNAPNAFATGRNEKHAVVAVTTGLLQILDKTELEGVIAHELSHVKNKDMLVSTVAVVLAGMISMVADVFIRMSLFGGGRSNDNDNKGNLGMIIGLVAVILAPIAAMMIQLAISRKREFLADASGALLTRYPEGLANALRKISQYSIPMKHQSSAIAHLYIADPTGKVSTFKKLFMTHPPVEERVRALIGNQ